MNMDKAIEAKGLGKSYGSAAAVNDVSFASDYGEIFGLIGPDGAGKTSLFKILATLIKPDRGEAKVGGRDIRKDYKKIRTEIGYMPGKFSLYQDLSVREHIEFFASVFGTDIKKSYPFIEPVYKQIKPFEKRAAGKLSGGMKQKLALCCALVHLPKILFLDEPTTGVDAVSRKEFWDILNRLKAKGMAIIVSTPYMDEAQRCDRIALMYKGSLLGIDSPQGIQDLYKDRLYEISSENMYDALNQARLCAEVKSCYTFGQSHHLVGKSGFQEEKFKEEMKRRGIENIKIKEIKAGIEDVFISLLSK